jgi:hypothetical protein
MRSSGAIVPGVVEEAHDDPGPDGVSAWIQLPDGAGFHDVGSRGIHVQVSLPPAERLADLADQLQDWEVEELAAAGRPATWPECPQHPVPIRWPLGSPATRLHGAARYPGRSSVSSAHCGRVDCEDLPVWVNDYGRRASKRSLRPDAASRRGRPR